MVVLSPFSDASAGMSRLRHLTEGMDVKFILPKQDKYGISEDNPNYHFPVNKRSFLSLPIYITRAVSYLNSQKPDVVYFYKPHPFTFPPAFIHKFTHPNCQTILDLDEWESSTMKDNGEPYYKRLFMDMLSILSMQFADKIIYTNENLAIDKIPDSKRYSGSFYIPNGVDTKEYKPIAHGTNERFTVMFVGLLRNFKRIIPIVDTIKIASKKIPNIQCVIIGDGPKRKEFEQLIDSKRLGEFFAFYGKVPQEKLIKLLPIADILIAPFPDLEGLHYQSNLKIFEYMAVGVPVITTNVGEMRIYLRFGLAGWVVKPDSPEELADAIVTFYKNPKKAQEMAGYARVISVEENDWKFRCRDLKEVINKKVKAYGINRILLRELPLSIFSYILGFFSKNEPPYYDKYWDLKNGFYKEVKP